MLLERYGPALRTCQPYLVATSRILPSLDRTRLPVPARSWRVFDPQRRADAEFVALVHRLDALTFGPVGLRMPGWVFYDCAVMPGAVMGLCRPAGEVPPWVRDALGVPPGYDGPVPLSTLIAIPTAEPDAWLLYTLCHIDAIAPGASPGGLEALTLVFGLRVFGISLLYGTVQWRSPRLPTFARLGPLEIITAWTPAHDNPRTLTFRAHLSERALDLVLAGAPTHPDSPPPTHMLDVDDDAELQRVQADVERGVPWAVVGPPHVSGSYTLVPVRRHGAAS